VGKRAVTYLVVGFVFINLSAHPVNPFPDVSAVWYLVSWVRQQVSFCFLDMRGKSSMNREFLSLHSCRFLVHRNQRTELKFSYWLLLQNAKKLCSTITVSCHQLHGWHGGWQGHNTGCPRRNGQNFGRVFLMLNYTDITQNTYIQFWTVTEIMAREVWNFDSCYTLLDYQIHIKTGRNMWFL